MSSSFSDILAHKRIIVCVGSGGVGKTTTAAALAVEGARRGRRTLVLTIDPAKRLANSLGLEALGHAIQRVPDEVLDAAGAREAGGELWAMMLDQKKAFDEVVQRYASDPAAIKRIIANPVYQQISGSLAGSQEYAAIAKLHELDDEQRWDLIIVDTPPTAHALDFLDAPQKLTEAIDSPAVEWFRSMRPGGGRSKWSVVGKTGSYVLKRISKFVGSRFLDDLAVFFTEFNDILGGFRERAEKAFALLRQDKVGFALVCTPDPMAVDEALFFHERLISSSMPFAAFIVNRVHTDLPLQLTGEALAAKIAATPAIAGLGLGAAEQAVAIEKLVVNHAGMQELARADRASIARLASASGGGAALLEVPFFRHDIHDTRGLALIGAFLFDRIDSTAAAAAY